LKAGRPFLLAAIGTTILAGILGLIRYTQQTFAEGARSHDSSSPEMFQNPLWRRGAPGNHDIPSREILLSSPGTRPGEVLLR
ncbi:MAG TPA: hypothetical protein VF374_03880, partial [Thermoplasmata archaeon]